MITVPRRRAAASRRPSRSRRRRGSGRCPGACSRYAEPAPQRPRRNSARHRSKMKRRQALEELDDDVAEDRVADDDVGHGAWSGPCPRRCRRSAGRTRRAARSRAGSGRRPCPSPRRSTAARRAGSATPRTRSAKIAPIRAYWARFSAVESGLAPMSSRTIGPRVGDHLDGEGRPVDAGQAAEAEDGGGHAGAGVAGGHDRVGLAALDEVHRDEDRGVLLLAERQRGVLVHADDLRSRGRSRRWRAGRRRARGRPPRRRRG